MGRYNLAATRVRSSAAALLETQRLTVPPPWWEVTADIPPPQLLVRPLQNVPVPSRHRRLKNKRPSKMFQPAHISYPEDKLRQQFFGDHPWELARPRIVLEEDGNDAKKWDWGKGIQQPGKALDGESVVQRQLWLIENQGMGRSAAYDQARHEFYKIRHLEAVRRRIAIEEAMSTGAYFGLNALEIGMDLENKAWEDWKVWANAEAEKQRQLASAQYGPMESDEAILGTGAELDAAVEEVGDSVPNTGEGQKALGGAAIHP